MTKRQKKQIIILGIVLAVLLVALLVVKTISTRLENAEDTEDTEITVATFSVEDIEAFSYTLDEETLSFTLSGTEWTCDSEESLDLDEDLIEDLLANLEEITASDSFTDYEDLSEYGFDDPSHVITVTTEAGTTTILIGDYNSFSGVYYMKIEDEDRIYLISGTLGSAFSDELSDLEYVEEETEDTEEVEDTEDVEDTEAVEDTEDVEDTEETEEE